MNSDDTYTVGQDPVTRKVSYVCCDRLLAVNRYWYSLVYELIVNNQLLARTFDDRLFWEEGSTPTLCLVR